MPANPLESNCFIDSCALDPKYEPKDQASDEILRTCKDEELLIQIPHSTQKEIQHSNTPAWVKHEALSLICTLPVQLTEGELRKLPEIETTLTGKGKGKNNLQDARHTFEAQTNDSYFNSTDSSILNRAATLHSVSNVSIVKPSNS